MGVVANTYSVVTTLINWKGGANLLFVDLHEVMALQQFSISLICIAIVIFCFKKTIIKKTNKCWSRAFVLCVAGVFFIIGSVLFIRQHFIPFSSPEEAYKYVYGGKTFVVIEGNESDYIIGDKDAKYLDKSKKGWTIPLINISATKGIKYIGSTTIYVSQYNFSEDYYVTVLDSKNDSLEIEDNRNSTFYKSKNSEKSSDVKSCVYYTYVNKINDEYTITVNGQEVKLLE